MLDAAKWGSAALRLIQLALAVIVMALIGNMIDDAIHGSSSVVNYNLFVLAFILLSLLYLIPASLSDKIMLHPILMFFIDALCCIFAFCGAIALPARQHVHSCSNKEYTSTNTVSSGSKSGEKTCREGQAATAFLWFLWFAFLLSTLYSLWRVKQRYSGGGGRQRTSPNRGQPPTMSQV
ncbi:Non-classical export protein Nce102 [Trichophyton interdigitale]|uniref:Non-classical export protein Nce102 n=1 Tax=Trichophyton interdigitale TaxID=101480 RepID=A0A9P4YKI7_9EURO|nr:Non-classical export protein Nce102 [Trichophyton interdigitale]KAF3900043.1 Non-classical export protein Nce102 [Trichophyton interdigitale]KAG8211136.1 Non-classical export protein Nce102 [Trichophyton interdigitale]